MSPLSPVSKLTLIGLLLLAFAGCKPETPARETVLPAAEVTVTPARLHRVPVLLRAPGSVVADRRIEVASRVVGFIETLDLREGQHVARGDVLVRIDPADIEQTIRLARAEAASAQEALSDARLDAERNARLVASGTASREGLRKAEVHVRICAAGLEQARAALAQAEAQRDYATIRSPADAVVVAVTRRAGEMATTGTPLLTIESQEALIFRTFVAQSRLPILQRATAVPVRIDALGGRIVDARLRAVVPSGDQATRSRQIDLLLPADPALSPGLFGQAEFLLGHREVIMIPQRAVVRQAGLEGVFVPGNGVARFRWLRLGETFGEEVEVVSGLEEREHVVLDADRPLRDGMPIRLRSVTP